MKNKQPSARAKPDILGLGLSEKELSNKKNKATIIRDSDGDIYLCIDGKPLDHPCYFKIECFATEPNNERELLSNVFEIDLTGEK